MNPTTTTRNDRLPLDVLTEIFPYYAAEETPQYPTETLLLICKSWHVAALAKHSIWGYFTIHAGHRSDTAMFLRRAEKRLGRSGDVSLMHIELQNIVKINPNAPRFMEDFQDHRSHITPEAACPTSFDKRSRWTLSCTCERSAYKCVEGILTLLAGPNGKHCARWRSLVLSPSSPQQLGLNDISIGGDGRIAQVLRYPMPKLNYLSMHNFMDKLSSGERILPHIPSLTHVALNNCVILGVPNAANLEFLGISCTNSMALRSWYKKQVWRTSMPRLKILKLNCPRQPLPCPESFPQLRTLDLRGEEFPMYKEHAKDPILDLTHLSLGIGETSLLESLETSIPEALKHVKNLRLWYNGPFLSTYSLEQMLLQLTRFLRLMSGVELLEGDMNMLGVVLKLMVDPPAPVSDSQLFGSRDISFRVSPGGSSGKLASPSTREDVVELASRLGVISPDKRWRWILGQLELKVL